MHSIVVGLNHKTAPLHIRERFCFSEYNLRNTYAALKTCRALEETCVLSTCNRVELYGVGDEASSAAAALKDFLYTSHEMQPGCLDEYLYYKTDTAAKEHICHVAAGLDSLVLGENQILRQIKRAYGLAQYFAAVGPVLHKMLQDALFIAKKVRSETHIARGVTSMPGAALEVIKMETGLETKRALVIGAGMIGALTVKKLLQTEVKEVVLVNRDKFKADALRKERKLRTGALQDLETEMSKAHIIIATTASPVPLVTHAAVTNILKRGGSSRKLLLIDLGVPRNIETSIKTIQQVRLFDVDDLGRIISHTLEQRAHEAEKADAMIGEFLCARSSSV